MIMADGFRPAGDLALALHDPVLDHDRARRGPAFESRLHVLGEGLFVFPLMLLYTAISLAVFRGKTTPAADHY
jgi:hypothetical protein